MIEWNAAKPKLEFEVSVGLMRVVVMALSREDAISSARMQMSREMPRMWDVIHGLTPDRFEVHRRETH